MGKVQNYIWQRWSLMCEYPWQFFGTPVVIATIGLIGFLAGLDIVNDLLWQFVLVCTAYVLWIVAVVFAVVNLLFMRPDRYQA